MAMDVAKHLNRGVDTQHHRLLFEHALALFGKCDDVLTAERKVPVAVELRCPFTRAKQVVKE